MGGGGGSGSNDIGSGRDISWDDPLSIESWIFLFCERAFRMDLRMDGHWTDPLIKIRGCI